MTLYTAYLTSISVPGICKYKVYLDNFSHANAGLQASEITASYDARGVDRCCAVRMRDDRGRGHGLLRAQQPAVRAGRMLRSRPLLRLAAVHVSRRTAQGVPGRGLLSGEIKTNLLSS